jgi:hypothetical protein
MKNEAVKEQAKFILYDQLQPVPRNPRRAWNVWDSTISVVWQKPDAGFSLERR